MLIKTAKVRIVRDARTEIVTTIPVHEIPVLKRVHGEGNVFVVDTGTNPRNLDPEGEADRLIDRYGADVVTRTFGELVAEGVLDALERNEAELPKAKKGKSAKAEAEAEAAEE